eukprot:scaffold98129_cov53-Attheya_sp.AAC.5
MQAALIAWLRGRLYHKLRLTFTRKCRSQPWGSKTRHGSTKAPLLDTVTNYSGVILVQGESCLFTPEGIIW